MKKDEEEENEKKNASGKHLEREFLIDILLVRIHYIIEMI